MLGHASPDATRRRSSLNLPGSAPRATAPSHHAAPLADEQPTTNPDRGRRRGDRAIAPRKGWPAARVKLSRRAWDGEPPGGECPPQSDGARRHTQACARLFACAAGIAAWAARWVFCRPPAAAAPKSHLRTTSSWAQYLSSLASKLQRAVFAANPLACAAILTLR